jgi:hypothetical protein
MSGGHYYYKFRAVEDMAEQIKHETCERSYTETERQIVNSELVQEWKDKILISTFLTEVASAMRTLEWYDSGDIGDFQKVRDAFSKFVYFPPK